MFVRIVKSKTKQGLTEYAQLCHNYWDPKAKKSKTRVIESLGRADDLDVKGIKRLINSLSRLLPEKEGNEIRGEMEFGEQLEFLGSREIGGSWLLDQLWHKMGINTVLGKILRDREYHTPIERLIFSMVANRALAPSSKLYLEHWVSEEAYISGLEKVESQQLYRAMDFLLEASEKIQKNVFFKVAHLYNLEVDLLFLDTTTTYFEIGSEDEELRKRGYSKDGRPGSPQVVIGFAVTRDGIPVRCWAWPGNTSDQEILEQVKKDLNSWRLGRVIMVQDAGFNSEENRRKLQTAGGHYIIGEKLRKGSKGKTAEALSGKGKFTKTKDGLEIKDVVIGGDGEARRRFVVVRNPEVANYEKERREDIIKETERRLENLKQLDGEPHKKEACKLRANPAFGRYIRQTKTGKLRLNKAKIRQEEFYDGKFLISTSDDTISAEDAVKGYKQLFEVERVFRDLKHVIDIRPVYHRLSQRIQSHILLCWLTMLLIRIAETQSGKTWFEIKKILSPLKVGIFSSSKGKVFQLNPVKPGQQKLFKILEIEAPKRFLKLPDFKKS